MGTATIFGTTYQTVMMPDGKEWIARDLQWAGAGAWWNDSPDDSRGLGRYYTLAEVLAMAPGSGWRVPTLADWTTLVDSVGGLSVAGGALKTTASGVPGMDPPNTGATNEYGFAQVGSGRYRSSAAPPWAFLSTNGLSWLIDGTGDRHFAQTTNVSAEIAFGSSGATVDELKLPVRLVRDMPIAAEAHETTHALALEWTEAADGTPVAYDDGAAYDYIESTITVRMTPDELTAMESAWQSSTKLYTITSTGYLLGPLIDMSAGVEVRLMSYQVDQSADSAMTLYDVTIGVHYGTMSAPSAGSLAVVQTRGRPYHSVAPGAASWITEGGTSDVNAYGRASERSCTWYTHSLTTAQAADVVNALRTLRGSSTTWTAGGVATPWGPGESGTATVWIPEWSVHRESNLLWGVQMELVRNG